MRKFKLFGTALLVIMVILWLLTLMLPSAVTVSNTALIDAGDSAVTAQITHLQNWPNWNPAYEGRHISTKIAVVKDTTYGWLTDSTGKSLKVAFTRPASNVIEVLFPEASGPKGSYEFVLIAKGPARTQLTWNVNTNLGWYPWRKIVGIFLDKMTGPIYERAIQFLKKAAEPPAS